MRPKKKNLTCICPGLILFIVCSLCVGTGSAMVEDSPYITINPVGDHAIGDIITISGTTNFPVNTMLWIQAGPKEYTKYPPHYIGEKVQIVQGANSNLWSIQINSSTFAIDEYNVLIAPLINDSSIFSYTGFNITARHTGTLQATSVPSTPIPRDSTSPPASSQPTVYPPEGYWIAIDSQPIGTHYTGESFTISGTTNISPGNELLAEIYPLNQTRSIKGTIYSGSAGKVTIKEGPYGKNTWSYPVDLSDFKPDEYRVIVSSYQSDAEGDAMFSVYETPSATTNCSSPGISCRESETSPTQQSASHLGPLGIIILIFCILFIQKCRPG